MKKSLLGGHGKPRRTVIYVAGCTVLCCGKVLFSFTPLETRVPTIGTRKPGAAKKKGVSL